MNPDRVAFSPFLFQLDKVTFSRAVLDSLDDFFRDWNGLNAASQDFIHPSCPPDFIVVEVDIEPGKEVVWKERFNLLDHLPGSIPERFEKRKKNVNLLVRQVGLNTMFVAGLRVDHVP